MTADQKDEIRALVREVLAEAGFVAPVAQPPANLFGVAGRHRPNTLAMLAEVELRRGGGE
jgi:hypothetical protein